MGTPAADIDLPDNSGQIKTLYTGYSYYTHGGILGSCLRSLPGSVAKTGFILQGQMESCWFKDICCFQGNRCHKERLAEVY